VKPNNMFGVGFKSYKPSGFDLIALRSREKIPLNAGWAIMPVDSRATVLRCLVEGLNLGVRLRADQLVIDVDPRNGGEEGFDKLCIKLKYMTGHEWPRVDTGSGGWHCYLALPHSFAVKEQLEEFPGVEFKSIGRQVVAAGSIHPNGNPYKWAFTCPDIRDGLPKAPKALLDLIRKPFVRTRGVEPGKYDNDQLKAMLAGLDVDKFNAHDKWLNLMLACHHATAGDGDIAFIDWSTSAHGYADHEDVIQKRWDSIRDDVAHAVTYRTLHKILRDHGAGHLIPARDVDDDEFPDDLRPRHRVVARVTRKELGTLKDRT
jgi:Bifunctional DNA primase/polymerase, N-terminal/Primase C terminal 2 (PriCT-2)